MQVPDPVLQIPKLPPEPLEPQLLSANPEVAEPVLALDPVPVLQLAWYGDPPEDDATPQAPAHEEMAIGVEDLTASPSPVLLSMEPSYSSHQLENHNTPPAAVLQSASQPLTSPSPILAYEQQHVSNQDSSAAAAPPAHKELSNDQLQEQWQEVQAASQSEQPSGSPYLWLNFAPPFAEPPPVHIPPCPQPGPMPVFVMPDDLEDVPAYAEPTLKVGSNTAAPAAVEACAVMRKLLAIQLAL